MRSEKTLETFSFTIPSLSDSFKDHERVSTFLVQTRSGIRWVVLPFLRVLKLLIIRKIHHIIHCLKSISRDENISIFQSHFQQEQQSYYFSEQS